MTEPKQLPSADLMSEHDDRRGSPGGPRPGPLGRLAGLAYRRRGTVLLAWVAVLAIAFGLSAALKGAYVNDGSVPGSDSAQAQTLLTERFPAQSGDSVGVVARAIDLVGEDHVSLGSDFDGGPPLPRGMRDVRDLPMITDAMLRRGYSEERIRKFLGGNLLRVFRQITEKSNGRR